VPKSLATFYYPKLVQAFSTSKREGVKSLKQMAKISGIINGCIFLGLFVCAPLILWILYGTKYMNVVPIFRILSVNYLLDAVRNITGNTIAVLKKVKANLVFSAVSGVLKVGINVLLISSMGSVGASISTVVITFCVVAMNSIYLWRQLRKG
jgi:O-antigen/teichoic acid export membrane protein